MGREGAGVGLARDAALLSVPHAGKGRGADAAASATAAGEPWEEAYRSCRLCPRGCGADRLAGQRGFCGAGFEARVARAALHFWEEPPLSGRSGSGTIFFGGCPLRCCYCQNAAISAGEAGAVVTAEELAALALDLQGQGALNVNLVTPTHFAPTARRAVSLARGQGLHLPVVWNTSGYEAVEAVRANEGTVDVYLTDFKYADAALGRAYSQVADYPDRALAALGAMVEQVGPLRFDAYEGQERLVRGVVVRHLLLPGHLEDSKRVVERLWRAFGEEVRLSLMSQYTPLLASRATAGDDGACQALRRWPALGRTVSEEEYEALLDFADDLGIEEYYFQQGDACEESFIPDFEREGIAR